VVTEASAGEGGAPGRPFIGARGEGSGGARRAPVRCTAPTLMPHSDDDETSRRGGGWRGRYWQGRGQAAGRGGAELPCAVRGWRGDGDEGTVVHRTRGRRRS
jgi:hypothetical protein